MRAWSPVAASHPILSGLVEMWLSRGRTALDSTALKTDLPRQDLDTHQEERIRIDPYGQQAEHPKADD
jgi:hypothetical protein